MAIVNAFSAVFSRAIHFLHFQENIELKLQQLNVPASVIKEYRKENNKTRHISVKTAAMTLKQMPEHSTQAARKS